MKTRWKITIEYDGTGYSGWQRQEDTTSIQQSVEEAIKAFSGQNVTLTCAGRTDAGVHAMAQVAHFDIDYKKRDMNGLEISKAINAHLRPQPISIIKAEKTDETFHARFNAKSKLYTYRIINRPSPPVLDKNRAWHHKISLDTKAMATAAKYLEGNHDFTTFRATGCQAKSPVRTLDMLKIETRDYDSTGGKEILIHAKGRSFLYHQVRNIAGTLALVGKGKWQPEDIKTALEKKDRRTGGPTAPPHGLYLVKIDY